MAGRSTSVVVEIAVGIHIQLSSFYTTSTTIERTVRLRISSRFVRPATQYDTISPMV
jgi:hypothetical protein